MSDNLALWNRFADIDPRFTKKITGKAYQGTSPNPQYVIQCLTEMFGPVGQGFGWTVIAEGFEQISGEVVHWCRISFWHTDRANTVESYGQTKASYTTSKDKIVVDEDAPKKSLTDAIIKAASWVGIASNIFLGRWDDQKYVEQVRQGFQGKPETPDQSDAKDRIAAALHNATSLVALNKIWDHKATVQAIEAMSDADAYMLDDLYKQRRIFLTQAPHPDA